MLRLLDGWKGRVDINGTEYATVVEALAALGSLDISGGVRIMLYPEGKVAAAASSNVQQQAQSAGETEYRITVKRYMTKKATPEFDFMEKWNNNVPMPLVTMTGTKVKETRGMVYMKLHGDLYAEKIMYCLKCGRPITNPVSQYFGMGPECGGHNYVHPFNTDEELKQAVSSYKKELRNITWEGWVIKSSILEEEVVA